MEDISLCARALLTVGILIYEEESHTNRRPVPRRIVTERARQVL